MITSWDIYWITRLDSINVMSAVVLIALGIVLVIALIPISVEEIWKDAEAWPTVKGLYKIGLAVFAICVAICVLTPSTKEFAAIYLIPKIANNEQVQKVPDNLLKLLNAKLENWIKGIAKDEQKK